MPNYILKKPIVFPDGTGFDVEPNDEILALTRRTITFAIGQPVASSSNVTFDNLNAASKIIIIDDDELVLSGDTISGSFTQTGDFTTSDNFTLNGDWNVDGTIIAEKIESELTQSVTIYESGSTLFGDTLNDLHDITGSLLISGSIYLNDNQSNEISNDILFNDSNLLTLVTENAIKTYLVNHITDFNIYERKSFVYKGTVNSINTASFTAVTASAPTGYTDTSEYDFMFFLNGALMENDAIEIEQSGSSLLLKVDNSSIGYNLEIADEIVSFGKFNS